MREAAAVLLILPLLAIAVGLALLLEPNSPSDLGTLDCVTGDAARNPVGPDGAEEPLVMEFDTIAAGEAFICLDVPQVGGQFVAARVAAERSHSLDRFEPDQFITHDGGYRFLRVTYTQTGVGNPIRFQFHAYPSDYYQRRFGDTIDADAATCHARRLQTNLANLVFADSIAIAGEPGSVLTFTEDDSDLRHIFICWRSDELMHVAHVAFQPGQDFDLEEDLLRFLGTPTQCVTGDAAENPTDASRTLTLPADKRFETIEQAQAWVCHEVPYPRHLGDWRLQGVAAHRSHGLDVIASGGGFWSVTLSFLDEARDVSLQLDVLVKGASVDPCGAESKIELKGQPATVYKGCSHPEHVLIEWHRDRETIQATGLLFNGLGLDEVLALLESIE